MPSDKAPQIPPTPEQEPILSFEEFSDRTLELPSTIPRYNNFFVYFALGPSGDIRRKSQYYKKFATEYPEMNLALCKNIQSIPPYGDVSELLKPFDMGLYEAYKIMRGYGISNNNLFA